MTLSCFSGKKMKHEIKTMRVFDSAMPYAARDKEMNQAVILKDLIIKIIS